MRLLAVICANCDGKKAFGKNESPASPYRGVCDLYGLVGRTSNVVTGYFIQDSLRPFLSCRVPWELDSSSEQLSPMPNNDA